MKYRSNNPTVPEHCKGMTLIEVILYVVLLSLLLTNIIQYEYDIHLQNIDLIHDIQDATASST